MRTLEDGGAPAVLLLALNDAIADGQDVSWIWDVDFEPLLATTERVIASGDRAAELGAALHLRRARGAARSSSSPTWSGRSTAGSS